MYIAIGDFLNQRLKQAGITYVFGVPGDFNLSYLEQIEADRGLQFIGTCNELNGAYAADGYARIKQLSVLVTTYGVGDLSAINGIAGAFAEHVPIVHISGIPPLHAVKHGAPLHHTLLDGNYDHIMNCMRPFTVAQTRLTPENIVDELDRVLSACLRYKQPVHIQLPSDITHIRIKQPTQPFQYKHYQTDKDYLKRVSQKIQSKLQEAKNPVLLIDHLADKFGFASAIQHISEKQKIPLAILGTAKNIISESASYYLGTYSGIASLPNVKATVETSDCLICFGTQFADINTGFFHYQLPENRITIQPYSVSIDDENFEGIEILGLIHETFHIENDSQPIHQSQTLTIKKNNPKDALSHKTLWPLIANFLKPNDIILGEAGCSSSGLNSIPLPFEAKYISQPIWSSIGYTLPALLGTLLASPQARHLLFIGDGSLQLTVQEISTIIRHQLKPIIFILNNGGYTVERKILGQQAKYNDIQNWRYTELAHVFYGEARTFHVETLQDLQDTLSHLENDTSQLTLVEIKLPKLDAPESLNKFGAVVANYDYGTYAMSKFKH